ncbi:response regulator [Aquincola sp. S2]|uniref:Response regulator n=1 Tax=Pseudaquabacterium terrae TaxID=2732868 RepID=A0ABX2EHI4_9BURK|nr:response regulator transcription factor [Aquabacterium terrae]NRF68089.1 response regulator [Aquabacterium terrae]
MKVLLIDDQALILAALQRVIRRVGDDVTLVGVDDLAAARQVLRGDAGFDLALLGLALEQPSGFEPLAELRRRHPELPVVVLSDSDRMADVIRAIDMGAMGFVGKRTAGEELHAALAMVMSGGVYMPPVMLGLVRPPLAFESGDTVPSVMRPAGEAEPGQPPAASDTEAGVPVELREPQGSPVPPAADRPIELPRGSAAPPKRPNFDSFGLTPRQTDVLTLLLKGLPNKLIARELGLSVDTVKDHVAAVLRALGVTSRTQAVLAVGQLTLGPQGAGWRPRED